MSAVTALEFAFQKAGLVPARVEETPKPKKAAPVVAEPYHYRNLACSCTTEDKLWLIEGVDARGGSGVLEWCLSREDAYRMLALMQGYPQFSGLAAQKWTSTQFVAGVQ